MTKIFVKTRSNAIIELNISTTDIEAKYGVKPGIVCIRKSDKGNNAKRVIAIGSHGGQLWFAREENGEYRVSYWDNVHDEQSFRENFDVFNMQYSEGDLLNMLSQPSQDEVNELLRVRKAIQIMVNYKWLGQMSESELSQKDKVLLQKYEEKFTKRQKTNWLGKNELRDEILHKINHTSGKFSR